jgi:hypothetical protein
MPEQKLVLLRVSNDPNLSVQDLTPQLHQADWWGQGWAIQQISPASEVGFVLVLLTRPEELPEAGIY